MGPPPGSHHPRFPRVLSGCGPHRSLLDRSPVSRGPTQPSTSVCLRRRDVEGRVIRMGLAAWTSVSSVADSDEDWPIRLIASASWVTPAVADGPTGGGPPRARRRARPRAGRAVRPDLADSAAAAATWPTTPVCRTCGAGDGLLLFGFDAGLTFGQLPVKARLEPGAERLDRGVERFAGHPTNYRDGPRQVKVKGPMCHRARNSTRAAGTVQWPVLVRCRRQPAVHRVLWGRRLDSTEIHLRRMRCPGP